MRISPNPTPITSTVAVQTPRVEPAVRAPEAPATAPANLPSAPAPRPEVTEPIVLNMGGTKFELQPNELAKVVDKMNETARIFNHVLRFEMEEGHRVKVRVLDSHTGQLVREIPPEKILEVFARLEDVIGVLLDQRA